MLQLKSHQQFLFATLVSVLGTLDYHPRTYYLKSKVNLNIKHQLIKINLCHTHLVIFSTTDNIILVNAASNRTLNSNINLVDFSIVHCAT